MKCQSVGIVSWSGHSDEQVPTARERHFLRRRERNVAVHGSRRGI